MPRFIDLSLPISLDAFEPRPPLVERKEHVKGGDEWGRLIAWPRSVSWHVKLRAAWGYVTGQRRITHRDFPDGLFLNDDIVTASVHCGSHLDAPFHFGPECGGKPARRIDTVPLEWCYGPGVVLDVRHRQPGEEITVADLHGALKTADYRLHPGDIVLIQTGTDRLWPSPQYFRAFPGMSMAATNWLLDQGIRTIGIDTPGFDRPFDVMMADYFRTRDQRVLWPAHTLGRYREYVHMERLARLHQLPAPGTFHVACFPVVVEGAGAGWVRAVAIVFTNGEDIPCHELNKPS
jgi:kynurenine formamidase